MSHGQWRKQTSHEQWRTDVSWTLLNRCLLEMGDKHLMDSGGQMSHGHWGTDISWTVDERDIS